MKTLEQRVDHLELRVDSIRRAFDLEGCSFGYPCPEHDGVHGAEAEELRAGIENLLGAYGDMIPRVKLIELLDSIAARDSLAYLEAKQGKENE